MLKARRRPGRFATAAPITTAFLAVVLAACGGGSPTAHRASSASSTTPSTGGVASPGSAGTTGGSGNGAGQAKNLPMTPAVRTALLAAGAALHSLPSSDYTGLVPGTTYYARDLRTGDLWAGAGLVPAPNSYDAGVRNQDEGAYMILTRSGGGAWHGWETGLTGGPPGPCPVTVPPAVLAVWGWPAGTCYPPSGATSSAASTGSGPTAQSCLSSQITAKLVGTADSQSQYQLVLMLTNGGPAACTMTGSRDSSWSGPSPTAPAPTTRCASRCRTRRSASRPGGRRMPTSTPCPGRVRVTTGRPGSRPA